MFDTSSIVALAGNVPMVCCRFFNGIETLKIKNMSTHDLFKKHFGNTAAVDMKHPNMESFFEELNAECLEEDKHKNCNIPCVSNSVCEHDYVYKILHDHTAADVCTKCGNIKKQTDC